MQTTSAGLRTNEALCWLSYEVHYLGPEGGGPGRPTQAVRLRKFKKRKFKIAPHKQKSIVIFFLNWQEDASPWTTGHT